MIYILSIIIFLSLIFLTVREFKNTGISIRKYFVAGLFFKLACGVGIGILYSQYYVSGDTFVFFEDGEKIAGLLTIDPVQFFQFLWKGDASFEVWDQLRLTQPRALFFSKFTAIGYLISFKSYWLVTILFSFISFFSAWKLVEGIIEYFPTTKEAAILAFLFFPSVIFWSSGLMKESLAMAGLFAVVYVFIKFWIQHKISVVEVLVLVVGLWLLWNLKYYYAGILLISMGAMWGTRWVISVRPAMPVVQIVILYFVMLVVPALLVSQLHPNFYVSRILEVILKNHDAYREISDPGNLIHYYQLKASLGSVLLNSPWAFISGLFRPFVWEVKSIFQFLAGVESLLVLILFFNVFRRIKGISFKSNLLLGLGIGTYIALLAIFLALSTPNIGTLVRYRVGFYPFFVYLLLVTNPWITQRKRLL